MNKKIHIVMLIAGSWIFSSCNSYLDIKPKGVVIPKTTHEFAALLNTLLDKLEKGEAGSILPSHSDILNYECAADNLDADLTVYPGGRLLPITMGDVIKTSAQYTLYNSAYNSIRDCNIIIDNLKEDGSLLNRNVLSAAYALRGLIYFNLMRLYAPAYDKEKSARQQGLVLVKTFDMEARPIRSNLEETLNSIIEDYKKALSLKPGKSVYIFSEYPIKALMAKAYFWGEKWEEAISSALEVLKAYPLIEGEAYRKMMRSTDAQKGNQLLKTNIFKNEMSENLNGYLAFRPVSKDFTDLFPEGTDDIRMRDSLWFNKKRLTTKPLSSNLRSAELCLIAAEAYAHIGNRDKALEYLNLLRSKRISNYKSYNAANLPEPSEKNLIRTDASGKTLTPILNAILVERQKELFMEGDRWFELKRNGCPEFWRGSNGMKYIMQKFLYTFPIPYKEIILTPGMIQNDGYKL